MSSETTENPDTANVPVVPGILTTDHVDEKEEQPEWYKSVCATIDTTLPVSKGHTHHGGLHVMHAVFVNASLMWDAGTTLTCAFIGPSTPAQREKVMSTVRDWEQYANIKFQFVSGNATVRISFTPRAGNWSHLGRNIQDRSISPFQATMNLENVDSNPQLSQDERGLILHEFGHTLGMQHEHQSPRRGEKLTLLENEVLRYYLLTQGWDANQTRQQVLNVLQSWEVSNYSALDFYSIMMYSMPWTLNAQRYEIQRNNVLSEMDKAFILLNYPTFGPTQSGWTVQKALDVTGVTGNERNWILYDYERRDWRGMRAWFTTWCINARTTRWRDLMLKDAEKGAEEGESTK